jgi:uncharacterized damage-inducible protein DinB
MNPTESQNTVMTRFREGPALLERSLADLEEARLDAAPTRGGWSIREIVHHVVDGDDLWKAGIMAALGNENGEFTLEWYWSLPQETWVERWAYSRRSLETSLELFRANRKHIAELVDRVPEAWDREIGVRKPDGSVEKISVGFIVGMQADHVEHHAARILAIRDEGTAARP